MTTELDRVARAEAALRDAGFSGASVAEHDGIARISVAYADAARLAAGDVRDAVVARVRACGFRYVAVDLDGE